MNGVATYWWEKNYLHSQCIPYLQQVWIYCRRQHHRRCHAFQSHKKFYLKRKTLFWPKVINKNVDRLLSFQECEHDTKDDTNLLVLINRDRTIICLKYLNLYKNYCLNYICHLYMSIPVSSNTLLYMCETCGRSVTQRQWQSKNKLGSSR